MTTSYPIRTMSGKEALVWMIKQQNPEFTAEPHQVHITSITATPTLERPGKTVLTFTVDDQLGEATITYGRIPLADAFAHRYVNDVPQIATDIEVISLVNTQHGYKLDETDVALDGTRITNVENKLWLQYSVTALPGSVVWYGETTFILEYDGIRLTEDGEIRYEENETERITEG